MTEFVEHVSLEPGQIIEVLGHRWRIRGCYYGAVGHESVIEIENLNHESAWTGHWEYHPVMYVPEVLIRVALRSTGKYS